MPIEATAGEAGVAHNLLDGHARKPLAVEELPSAFEDFLARIALHRVVCAIESGHARYSALVEKVLLHRRCNECADEFTNTHVPQLSLQHELPEDVFSQGQITLEFAAVIFNREDESCPPRPLHPSWLLWQHCSRGLLL